MGFSIKNMSIRHTCCSKNDLFSHGSCQLFCTGENAVPNKPNQNWVSPGAAQPWFFARRRLTWSEAGRGTKSSSLVMMPALAWFLAGLSRSSSLGEFYGQGSERVCPSGCLWTVNKKADGGSEVRMSVQKTQRLKEHSIPYLPPSPTEAEELT